MSERLTTILAELRARLEALYGARLERLVLFGSQARGDADPDSDIDVLVVLKGSFQRAEEDARTLDLRVDMNLTYGLLIQLIIVSDRRYQYEKSPLFMNVRREGVRL